MNSLKGQSVSILIPVYNEALAIRELLDRVMKAPVLEADKEVIVVDDGSSDETVRLVRNYMESHPFSEVNLKLHPSYINHGKGAALRAGIQIARGDIIIIQDGDLEYSPDDYSKLLTPFVDPRVDIVYGNRFHEGYPRGMKILNLIANRILSWVASFLYGQHIADEATGYKVFRKQVLEKFTLKCRGFEFCPEFTAKSLKSGFRILEVPIHYNPRGIMEGKKIRARDGFIAIWWLLKLRFRTDTGKALGSALKVES